MAFEKYPKTLSSILIINNSQKGCNVIIKVTVLVNVFNYFHVAKFNGKFSVLRVLKESVISDTVDRSFLYETSSLLGLQITMFSLFSPTYLTTPSQPSFLVFYLPIEEFLFYSVLVSEFIAHPSYTFKNCISANLYPQA